LNKNLPVHYEKTRKYSAACKTQVVLEALKERSTLSELAQKYELYPNQIIT
jgi:transposase-like protein